MFAVVFGAALGSWLGTSPASAQDDGLRIETETTYRVLPDEFAIDVEISYSVTNQVPNRTQGFTTTRTFFSAIFESIPSPTWSTSLEAMSMSGSATVAATIPGCAPTG